ncbi:MAG: glycosyltransferase 87 family protein [Acidobacteriaceae bacterium]|jgi:hypothetical protein
MNGVLNTPGLQRRVEQVAQPKTMRVIAEFLVVGICTLAFALNASGILTTLIAGNYAGDRDFVSYWSAGHQVAEHANPYDGKAILGLEHGAGFSAGHPPLVMRNPPPALLLVLPLGFLSVRAGSFVWSLLQVASLVVSVQMIAATHGRSKSQLNILAYTFAPVLSCLIAGQLAIFVLLGLVLFLRFHKTRPLLAGASLWLCALKPHLFLPFGVVLLAWIVVSRGYKILAGAAAAFGLSAAVVFAMDPAAWSQYAQAMKAEQLPIQIIPCVSVMLRLAVSPGATWLQFLPAALGCAWALAYFQRHRDDWDWWEHGSLLMLVSVVVAPYSWYVDEAVVLPALLHALYRTRSRSLVAILALLSAAIEIGNVLGLPLRTLALYVWTAPAWLGWYLWAMRSEGREDQDALPQPVGGITTVTEEA